MAFCKSADGRITGHTSDCIFAGCNEKRMNAHASGGKRGFRTGVTATDNDNIIVTRKIHEEIISNYDIEWVNEDTLNNVDEEKDENEI